MSENGDSVIISPEMEEAIAKRVDALAGQFGLTRGVVACK